MKRIINFVAVLFIAVMPLSVSAQEEYQGQTNVFSEMNKLQHDYNRKLVSRMSSDLLSNPVIGWESGGIVRVIFVVCFLIALAQAITNRSPSGMMTEMAQLAFYSWLIMALLGGPTYQKFSFLQVNQEGYSSNTNSLDIDIFNFVAYQADTLADQMFAASGPSKLFQASQESKNTIKNLMNARKHCNPNNSACMKAFLAQKGKLVDPDSITGNNTKEDSSPGWTTRIMQVFDFWSDLNYAVFYLFSWAVDLIRAALTQLILIGFGIITGVSFFFAKFMLPFAIMRKYRGQVFSAMKVPLSAALYGLATSLIVYVSAVAMVAMNQAAGDVLIEKIVNSNNMGLLAMIPTMIISMFAGQIIVLLLQVVAIVKVPTLCHDLLNLSMTSFVNFAREIVGTGMQLASMALPAVGGLVGGMAGGVLGKVAGAAQGIGDKLGISPGGTLGKLGFKQFQGGGPSVGGGGGGAKSGGGLANLGLSAPSSSASPSAAAQSIADESSRSGGAATEKKSLGNVGSLRDQLKGKSGGKKNETPKSWSEIGKESFKQALSGDLRGLQNMAVGQVKGRLAGMQNSPSFGESFSQNAASARNMVANFGKNEGRTDQIETAISSMNKEELNDFSEEGKQYAELKTAMQTGKELSQDQASQLMSLNNKYNLQEDQSMIKHSLNKEAYSAIDRVESGKFTEADLEYLYKSQNQGLLAKKNDERVSALKTENKTFGNYASSIDKENDRLMSMAHSNKLTSKKGAEAASQMAARVEQGLIGRSEYNNAIGSDAMKYKEQVSANYQKKADSLMAGFDNARKDGDLDQQKTYAKAIDEHLSQDVSAAAERKAMVEKASEALTMANSKLLQESEISDAKEEINSPAESNRKAEMVKAKEKTESLALESKEIVNKISNIGKAPATQDIKVGRIEMIASKDGGVDKSVFAIDGEVFDMSQNESLLIDELEEQKNAYNIFIEAYDLEEVLKNKANNARYALLTEKVKTIDQLLAGIKNKK